MGVNLATFVINSNALLSYDWSKRIRFPCWILSKLNHQSKLKKKLSLCPLWLLVEDEGDESLDSGADGGEGQVDQHEEEQERPDPGGWWWTLTSLTRSIVPKWRQVHGQGGLWISYKRQSDGLLELSRHHCHHQHHIVIIVIVIISILPRQFRW